jgi:hypothetical protein
MLEPGEVLTDNQRTSIERAFRVGAWAPTPEVEEIAGRIADTLYPLVLKRLPADLDPELLLAALGRLRERVSVRLERHLYSAAIEAEEKGFPTWLEGSLDRALEAAMAQVQSSEREVG